MLAIVENPPLVAINNRPVSFVYQHVDGCPTIIEFEGQRGISFDDFFNSRQAERHIVRYRLVEMLGDNAGRYRRLA